MDRRQDFSSFQDIKWSDCSSIEEFRKSVPHYKSFSNEVYYLSAVPDDVWPELEGLINKKGNLVNKTQLINKISTVVPCASTTNWGEPFLTEDVKALVCNIRKKTDAGHIETFMDCMGCLVNSYDDILSLNEFLNEHNIGYRLEKFPGYSTNYRWSLLDMNIIRDEMQPAINEARPINRQAYEEFDRAKKLLKETTSDRTRKDILNNCLRAMEAIIKEYGDDKNIDNATTSIQRSQCFGSQKLVRDGKSIFHDLQDEYPDLRHGAPDNILKEISPEETEYWLRRIIAFSIYLMQRGEKVRGNTK